VKPHIGTTIKFLRLCDGYSLRELERRSGVANATISLTEQGRTNPALSTLTAIAKGLGMTAGELLVFHESAPEPSTRNQEPGTSPQ
jgi:transcriptional regulator with XRE-family HTH domain